MSTFGIRRYALSISAAALLAGCGGGSGAPLSPSPAVVRAAGTQARPAFTVLYSFAGTPDGELPLAGLLNVNERLFGTTSEGGTNYVGAVFKITTSGIETVLHSFARGKRDGIYPEAGLINVKGSLYGTTSEGGASSYGTVFKLSMSGKEGVIHNFKGASGDGASPGGGLLDVRGTLYGTSGGGGASDRGTVYAITTSGTETVLHSFGGSGDGASPEGGLLNVNGTLYGTTVDGGTNGYGTVFYITTTGKERVLYSFAGGAGDGAYPWGTLLNLNGTLYGTTAGGGGSGCNSGSGCGTVFSITPSGTETVLHIFGASGDGAEPFAGLIDVEGTLYGTTRFGGGKNGDGTVFRIGTDGKGENVLHNFKGGRRDGALPWAALIKVDGSLFGTTELGGAKDAGTIFSLKP
jgi:uncharacterized repeat protein (TIGR03803 family)